MLGYGTENHIKSGNMLPAQSTHWQRRILFSVDTGMCCVWGAQNTYANRKENNARSFQSRLRMANAMPMGQ